MSLADSSVPLDPSRAHPGHLVIHRGLTLVALSALLWFVGRQGFQLWNEWSVTRDMEASVRRTTVVGYPGIAPRFSYAEKPSDWFHDEGESTVIWGGWKHDVGHQWFRVGRGEILPVLMSDGFGRDVIQVIDAPVVEGRGDVHWDRIPDEAFVAGHRLGGVDTAYPLLVLDKVIVVNDTIADRPYLVTFNPCDAAEELVAVYEPVVEGHRVTMGMTGYFYDNRPLLFDRGTESLWIGEPKGLHAIAGKHKGQHLRRLARPAPIAWGRWRIDHPESRLVVGADRSRPLPEL